MRGPRGIARAVVRTVEEKHEWKYSETDIRRMLKLPEGSELEFVANGDPGDTMLFVRFTETKGARVAGPKDPSAPSAKSTTGAAQTATVAMIVPMTSSSPRTITVEHPDGKKTDTAGNPKP